MSREEQSLCECAFVFGSTVLISGEGEEQEAEQTACTVAVIGLGFGRERRRFITSPSKHIIERVNSFAGTRNRKPPGEETGERRGWHLKRNLPRKLTTMSDGRQDGRRMPGMKGSSVKD